MKIKTVILSALLVSVPVTVRAQDVDNYENYKVACDSGAECNSFEVNYQDEDKVAQSRRTRTRIRRTRSTSDDTKYYAGATIGVFLPSDIDDFDINVASGNTSILQTVDPGTGFGGSFYGGYKFTDSISVDIEGLAFTGNADPLDSSYTSFGFFLNPRFTYTFNPDNDKSLYAFASPGLGLAVLDFGDEISDAQGVNDGSGTGFALQGKIGIGYPVSDKIDIIGQGRYFHAFNVIETTQFGQAGEASKTEDKGFDNFSFEIGANFKF